MANEWIVVVVVIAAGLSAVCMVMVGWWAYQKRVDMKNVELRLRRPF